MNPLTRDVVVDLWPLYVSGEASADSRALIEAFIEKDTEFGRRLRETETAHLQPPALKLPVDHELATLSRLQARRARQAAVVNAAALLVSAGLTAFYLWEVVPRWAATFAAAGVPLPAAMRMATQSTAWALRLGLPVVILGVPAAILFRRRLRVPMFLRSGVTLAVITGAAVVIAQLGWLSMLNEASIALEEAYRSLGSPRP